MSKLCPSCSAPLTRRSLFVDVEPGLPNYSWACGSCHREFTENLKQQRIDPAWKLAHPEAV